MKIERELVYEWNGKKTTEILKIISIEQVQESLWKCKWSLPHVCPNGSSSGVDALHSLLLSLRSIRKLINDSGFENLRIYQDEPGDCGNISLD